MPTFPSSPPKIPYGGFSPVRLQGWLVRRGLPKSDAPLSCPPGLHPSFVLAAFQLQVPALCRGSGALPHRHSSGLHRSTPGALAPVRVVLSRSIHACPAHPPHSQAHPDFATMWLIREAFAVRVPPRRPASGSVLSLCVPSRPAVLYLCGESIGCSCPVPSPTTLAFAERVRLGTPKYPQHPLPMGRWFSRLPGSLFATACRVAGLPGGPDRVFPPTNRGVYSRAFDGSVTLPAAEYNYSGN
jgi:hypothetical protein